MPRPLKFGRMKQTPEKKQVNKPYTESPAPTTFTGPFETQPARIPSNTGFGGLQHAPSPYLPRAAPQEAEEFSSTDVASPILTGALAPRTVELPMTIDVGGVLYRRVDTNCSEDVMMTPSQRLGSSASMSSLRRDRGHLPRLDSEQHIEVPEPVLKREPETTPPFTTGSSQSARPRRKRDSRMLREIEARNRIPESSSGSDEERLFVKQATNSSQPASQKRRRTSKMLRELEAHNRSPKGSPDSEQDEIFVRNRRSSQSVSLEPKRKSKLLRELEAHNQSPEPEPGRHDLKDDWGDFGRTRGARKELEDIFNGTPSTPRKSMSVKTLMLEQFSGKEKDTKTFYAEDDSDLALRSCRRQQNCMNAMFEEEGDEEGEEEDFLQNLRTNGRSHPQLIPARRTRPSQANMPIRNRQRVEDVATEMVWPTLDKQKERISELLAAPRYNPNPSQHEMDQEARKKPTYHPTAEISQSMQGTFHMERGLYVFAPTLADYSDFGTFLKVVEEIAGRKMGVVKVIVPSESLSPTPYAVGTKLRRSRPIETTRANINLNGNAMEEPCKVYNISITDSSTSLESGEWLRMIKSDREKIIRERHTIVDLIYRTELWKEYHMLEPYSETDMIHHGLKQNGAVVCALDQPAKSNLRAALQCKDPHVFDLLGNRFADSRSTEPGINESVFQIAGGKGPVSPLQMNSYAAYSLNYHHSGASRIITVTTPKSFAKLEEFMHIAQNGGTVLGRPWKSPQCSQFVKHQPMYVPHATLSLNNVEYTEVVQHQGEMVIIFPYAYHQAYVSGPNITEEVLYASDRIKVFHREQLYHHCSTNCAGGKADDFDLKLVFSNTLETAHRSRAGRDFDLTSISPRQSQDASTSQSNDDDSSRPKRPRGLSALDLISDGGGEWLPSDHDPGFEGRNSSRLTSNPNEPDMWDPDSAFEPTYGQASNDEDTPAGGNTPRRGRGRGSGRKRGSSSGGTPRKRRTR